jgi:hypothetical protein
MNKADRLTLVELLPRLGDFDDEFTIYAEANPKWSPESTALVRQNEGETTGPIQIGGRVLSYMLEVDLAREAIEVWSEWRNGRQPTPIDMCAAVIYYATHDAFLPE